MAITLFNLEPTIFEVIKVKLPFGDSSKVLTFSQGDQIVAEELVAGTRDTYKGTIVADALTDEPAIIFNQDVYKDQFGNRPNYVQNVGLITYKSGEVVTAVRPRKNVPLQITADAVTGELAVGSYLQPKDGTQTLEVSPTKTAKVAYKIEALENIRVGNTNVPSALTRTIV